MPPRFKILLTSLLIILTIFTAASTRAVSVDELKAKSLTLSEQIKKLDAEIATINKELITTKTQKNTLNNELKQIDATRTKLLAELSKTEKQISISNNNIQALATEISGKNHDISENHAVIAEALRGLNDRDRSSFLEVMFSDNQLSELVSEIENLAKLQKELNDNIAALKANKQELETKKVATETEKKTLTGLKAQLADQKQVVDQTKKTKDTLLTKTKNQESTYQQMIADRQAKKKAVEDEMADIEAQIKIAIDPSTLPQTAAGVLSWPLSKIIITQYFGNTAFATQNSQVYNGKGHNGVDFGTPIGTPILAAAEGQVIGTGDTDKTCAGASYGRWVLIKHTNGLSTLYAHLSVIRAVEGQTVARGDTIGLSGNTGYSTGPHLHFSVYASAGVSVSSLQSKVAGCGVYRLPIASYNSYLNPMSFLGK